MQLRLERTYWSLPHSYLPLGGPSSVSHCPNPIGAGALRRHLKAVRGRLPNPVRRDFQTGALSSRSPTSKLYWPQTLFSADLDFEGAQEEREGEAGACPHTLQVVNCWLWFSWKALKWLSEHSLLGPYILWQGCHDPRGVASKPHPLGCFVGCFAAWHRDPGLTDLLSPKPITQETQPFSVYP